MARSHGFESPLDPHQVGSWVAFGIFVVSFAALYAPLHTDIAGIILSCLYVLLGVATFYSGLRAMHTNPADRCVVAKRRAQEQQLQPPPPPPEATNYCYLCESNVHKRSKHCRKCNKCVEAFDHHCPWLNTCVGAVNYRHFLSLLVAALSLVTLQIGSFVQSGVLLFQEPERSRYGMPPAAYGALLVAILVPLLLGWLMLTQLLTFHAALISRGLTTYEFIIAQRDKQRALDMATGSGASVGWRAKRAAWINRNAPCLAVCELCDESPAPRPHPARSESARRRGLSGSNLRKQVVATSRQATATSAASVAVEVEAAQVELSSVPGEPVEKAPSSPGMTAQEADVEMAAFSCSADGELQQLPSEPSGERAHGSEHSGDGRAEQPGDTSPVIYAAGDANEQQPAERCEP